MNSNLKSKRKIIKTPTSNMISLPKVWIDYHSFQKGDTILCIIDCDWNLKVVKNSAEETQ